MNKAVFVCSFALTVATASTSFADVYQPNYWRCAADQLFGSPSAPLESRTGHGRTTWARNAMKYWKYSNPPNATMANRFWLSYMDVDVADAAAQNIDLYPVYADPASPTGIWVGPGPNQPAGSTYYGTTYTAIRNVAKTLPTTTAHVDALCEAGCYSPDQRLQFGDETLPIADAYASGHPEITTLAPDATFDSIGFMANRVARWTVDIAPAAQELITLRMQSGGELRVTIEHPVLTSEGEMKRAATLVVGDSLVREDGSPDAIVSTSRSNVFTKVYNVRPATTDLISNIVIAQGYLNGSARYQSEYVKYLNRVLLRRKLPPHIIPGGAGGKPTDGGDLPRTELLRRK